jgi:hypothetical protein
MLPLFDDADPDPCAKGHAWTKTLTQWPGEAFVRLTWTCSRCKEVRGRA